MASRNYDAAPTPKKIKTEREKIRGRNKVDVRNLRGLYLKQTTKD